VPRAAPEPDAEAVYRARLDTLKIERRSPSTVPPRGAESSFEKTSPAMFRKPGPRRPVIDWFWADPRKRPIRVGAALSIFTFVAVFFVTAHRGRKSATVEDVAPEPTAAVKPPPEPARASEPASPPAPVPPPPAPPTAVAEAAPSPSSEPEEKSEEHHKHHHKARVVTAKPAETVALAAPLPAPSPAPPAVAPAATEATPPKPPEPAEPDLDDPYKPIENPYSKELRVGSGAKKGASSDESANAAPARPAVDCTQPYAIDAHGIRHPRPECLK